VRPRGKNAGALALRKACIGPKGRVWRISFCLNALREKASIAGGFSKSFFDTLDSEIDLADIKLATRRE
jgi:hypothetical protein